MFTQIKFTWLETFSLNKKIWWITTFLRTWCNSNNCIKRRVDEVPRRSRSQWCAPSSTRKMRLRASRRYPIYLALFFFSVDDGYKTKSRDFFFRKKLYQYIFFLSVIALLFGNLTYIFFSYTIVCSFLMRASASWQFAYFVSLSVSFLLKTSNFGWNFTSLFILRKISMRLSILSKRTGKGSIQVRNRTRERVRRRVR